MPSPEELATRAEYFLQELDLSRRECAFLQLPPGAYRASAFLDHRIQSEQRDPIRIPLDAMVRLRRELEPWRTWGGAARYWALPAFMAGGTSAPDAEFDRPPEK